MKIWIVMDSDWDNTRIVAAYATEAMAAEHVALMDGNIEEVEVRSVLHPDATDPIKQRERADEESKRKQQYQASLDLQERSAKQRAEVRPNPPHMSLCDCETFSTNRWLVNNHGYCGYCGGFVPEVYRKHMGENALQAEIDKLAIHNREKMRLIVANLTAP